MLILHTALALDFKKKKNFCLLDKIHKKLMQNNLVLIRVDLLGSLVD